MSLTSRRIKSRIRHADGVANIMTQETMMNRLVPAYQQALTEVRGDLAALYQKHAVAGKLSFADVERYGRLKRLEDGLDRALYKVGNTSVSAISSNIQGVYQEAYYRTAFMLEQGIGGGLDFGILPEKQIEAAIYNPLDRITWPARTRAQIEAATRAIKNEIIQGIAQGRDYGAIAAGVTERANKSATEMQRIIQTEAHRAREAGKLDCFETAWERGLSIEKVWLATMDEATRDHHAEMDGQKVPVYYEDDQPGLFTSLLTGAQGPAPGQIGTAEDDINCRCAMISEFPNLSADQRRFRVDMTAESYVGPDMTYLDWAAKKGIKPHYKSAKIRRNLIKLERELWNKTAQTGLEHGAFYTDAGRVSTRKVGGETSIQYAWNEAAAAKKRIAIHTHPSATVKGGRAFSKPDINFAISQNVKEMKVISGKEFFIMKPGPDGWPKGRLAQQVAVDRWDDIRVHTKGIYQQRYNAGQITLNNANAAIIPETNRKWVEEFGMIFIRGGRRI